MKDIDELFEDYIEEAFKYNWEGCTGVRKLEQVCTDLGYRDGHFIGGSSILNFLADNSGAIEGIIEFVRNHIKYADEWQENLDLQSYQGEEESEEH